MRAKAANTQRLWRGIPSWQRSLFALVAVLAALVQLGGSSAAVADPPEVVGEWSAPFTWPIVAVHMSLTSTGEVFSLDGFGAGAQLRAALEPDDRASSAGSLRAQPLLLRPHSARRRADAARRRPHQRVRGARGHDALQRADEHLLPRRRTWPRRAGTRPRRSCLTAACSSSPATGSSRTGPGRCRRSPTHPSTRCRRSTTRPRTRGRACTSAQLTTPLYPQLFVLSDGRILDVGPDTTTRVLTPGTWTWSTVTTSPFDGHSAVMYRPNKIMKSGTWADPDFGGPLAYDTNGRTAVIDMSAPTPAWRETAPMAHGRCVPQPDAASRRHRARERRQLSLRRRRSDQVGAAGRDLEPGHGDVDDRRLAARTGASTTRRRCCCPTAAC